MTLLELIFLKIKQNNDFQIKFIYKKEKNIFGRNDSTSIICIFLGQE